MTQIFIPTPLRSFTEGKESVDASGPTIADVLTELATTYPRLRTQLFDARGELHRFVTLFLNDQDIRMLDGLQTDVRDSDTIEVLPAIAGGSDAVRGFPDWRRVLQNEIPHIDSTALMENLRSDATPVLIDVRTAEEWDNGHIPSALHIDRGFLEQRIEQLVPDRAAAIVCYCESGVRSLFATKTLRIMGYAKAVNLSGGIKQWKSDGGSIVIPQRLTKAEQRRYLRHLAISEVGEEGQHKLLQARVLIIGAGGLGCPVALYLAAAGVGTLGIVDDDVVDESNLQRQILHRADRVGILKTESAKQSLLAINPGISVNTYARRLDRNTALEIFGDYDIIVDGSDNFATRYVINDCAVALGLPVVHGSVYRFEGQASVFWAGQGPCYRCLYPEAPPPELAPSCAEAGVLGVLPGTIGLLQATETLKLVLGIGQPLIGRAIRYDALSGRFRELKFTRNPGCDCCKNAPFNVPEVA